MERIVFLRKTRFLCSYLEVPPCAVSQTNRGIVGKYPVFSPSIQHNSLGPAQWWMRDARVVTDNVNSLLQGLLSRHHGLR